MLQAQAAIGHQVLTEEPNKKVLERDQRKAAKHRLGDRISAPDDLLTLF